MTAETWALVGVLATGGAALLLFQVAEASRRLTDLTRPDLQAERKPAGPRHSTEGDTARLTPNVPRPANGTRPENLLLPGDVEPLRWLRKFD